MAFLLEKYVGVNRKIHAPSSSLAIVSYGQQQQGVHDRDSDRTAPLPPLARNPGDALYRHQGCFGFGRAHKADRYANNERRTHPLFFYHAQKREQRRWRIADNKDASSLAGFRRLTHGDSRSRLTRDLGQLGHCRVVDQAQSSSSDRL